MRVRTRITAGEGHPVETLYAFREVRAVESSMAASRVRAERERALSDGGTQNSGYDAAIMLARHQARRRIDRDLRAHRSQT